MFYAMSLSGRRFGRAIALLIGIIVIAGICLKLVLKPLFKIFEPCVKNGEEIKKKNYPEFFQMIEDIVAEVGCQLPKHVYVSNECNAYVYYPSLWGNIFHGRQNLTVGLPLIMTLNKTELKAVLSHEFGHFTQKSVSINRVANLSEYICGAISRSLEQVENADEDSYAAKTQFFAKIVTKIMMGQYVKVTPLNGILSRAQEFDADGFSCRIAGTEGAISSLSKISYFDECWSQSMNYLAYCMKEQKRVPAQIKVMVDTFLNGSKLRTGVVLSPSEHLRKPMTEFRSRLSFVNNDTHPSMSERCDAIMALPMIRTEWDDTPALGFFNESLVNKVFNTIVSDYRDIFFYGTTVFFKKDVAEEEMKDMVSGMQPAELNAFYERDLFFNSVACVDSDEGHEEYEAFPFTKENADVIMQYDVASDDLDILNRIVEENSPTRTFYYRNKRYTGDNAPLEEHKTYFKSIATKAIDIVRHCNYWMTRKAISDENLGAYYNLFCWAGMTQVALNNISEAMESVSRIARQHDTSTKAVEYINAAEHKLRQIADPMMEEGENGISRFLAIAKWMAVNDEIVDKVVDFFRKPVRESDAQVCEIANAFYRIMSDYRGRSWDMLKAAWIVPIIASRR